MATTTNFGWETPDDTDLVKDGAAAIRTLGNSIDTSMVDLKGGTTGQVLSKNSNTDMDFTWVAQDDSNAIQNAIVDAKGDLIAASAADTPARLAVGTNEHRLVADSAQTTGLKYVADTTNYAIAAKGDLLVGTAADTLQALTVGTNGYTLVADSGAGGGSVGLKWAVDPVADIVTSAGDILYATAADTLTRLGIGTAGQVLTVNAGATAPEWAAGGGAAATWANYTPTWTNLTVGNGTNSGRYIQIDKVVFFNAYILFGSTTSVSGGIEVSVPVTAGSTSALAMGNYTVMVVDDGVGNWFATVNTDRVNWTDTGKIRLIPWKANDTYVKFDTNFSSTVPFTWATSDRIMVAGYYEVA